MTSVEISRRLASRLPQYARVQWTESTGSTNADLLADVTAPAFTALIAGHQSAGRGRLGRPWTAPPGSQAILSVLLRPSASELDRLGTIPLATGLAVLDAVRSVAHAAAGPELKWPNDVLWDGQKICGILAEAAGFPEDPRIVVGLGVNVSLTREELPVPHATSLALQGIDVSAEDMAVAVLEALHRRLAQWATGDRSLMDDYRAECITIGKPVRVEAPTGELFGTVTDVAPDGRIDLRAADGSRHLIAAGDVTHLRRTDADY
ncbi:biotin--[acetyl-CoA-carboxylase] ligase [Corynebacterium comes]|uniref:biotin--[biotin carboxyl-carrier protein] ligase n=1 Tax=Corynebacterium comes TaxID=2675218 RepID=A0A6B8VLF6_9CORY|nr:biotin--[acetyl-CoA-carboxylase] ligase [Corynebacterium comes]QGU03889.1 Bifunctional ligase/repressor BirA [Corynebacterium comes]